MNKIIIGLIALIIIATFPVQAHNEIQETLIEKNIDHVYIYNREDGKADSITIINPDVLEEVCNIKGVIAVTLNGKEYICNSK